MLTHFDEKYAGDICFHCVVFKSTLMSSHYFAILWDATIIGPQYVV